MTAGLVRTPRIFTRKYTQEFVNYEQLARECSLIKHEDATSYVNDQSASKNMICHTTTKHSSVSQTHEVSCKISRLVCNSVNCMLQKIKTIFIEDYTSIIVYYCLNVASVCIIHFLCKLKNCLPCRYNKCFSRNSHVALSLPPLLPPRKLENFNFEPWFRALILSFNFAQRKSKSDWIACWYSVGLYSVAGN